MQYSTSLEFYDALGVSYEDWDTGSLIERVPYYDPHRFSPPSRPTDEGAGRGPESGGVTCIRLDATIVPTRSLLATALWIGKPGFAGAAGW